MSIIDTLITDRSQSDVDRALTLSAKGWAAMTAAEKEEFEAGMKGAYNATDLNRVNAAMEYLDTRLKAMGYMGGYYQKVEVPHKQSGSVLPEGYTQVEYIQSSGTQYIDTGFKPNNNTRVLFKMELIGTFTSYKYMFGARSSTSSQDQYAIDFPDSSTIRSIFSTGVKSLAISTPTLIVDQNKNVCTVNGESMTNANSVFQTGYSAFIFDKSTSGNSTIPVSAKLFYCQLYDNGTLIRDYIPCIDPSGEAGLYDIVNGAFYGNEGTGAFLAGPQVVALPDGYKQLEYIQSDGDQYVDTGLKPNQDTRTIMDLLVSSENTGTVSPFGERDENASGAPEAYIVWGMKGGATVRSDYFGNAVSSNTSIKGQRVTIDKNKNVCTIGATTITNTAGTGQAGYNLYLLACNQMGTGQYGITGNLYLCRIYGDDTISRDYVPCQAPDGDVGLYDLVTKEFYGNSGTGTFIAGPEVEAPDTPDEPGGELDPYTWYVSDIPTPEALEAYLDNVRRFRSAKPLFATTPQVPDDMELATIDEWNDIEQILVDIETSLISIAKAAIYAGTPYIFAGGPMIYATGG